MSGRTSFAAIEVLLIDGNNLLHRLSGGTDPAALRGLLPSLAGTVPVEIVTVLMLDGHPAPGTGRVQRIRRGLEVHYAGPRSADDALLNLVRDTPPGGRAMTTIVTDDRPLTERARSLGAHTQRLAWLVGLLGQGGGAGAGIGAGSRPARPAQPPVQPRDEEDRVPWQPGRGATRKRGNPHRAAR